MALFALKIPLLAEFLRTEILADLQKSLGSWDVIVIGGGLVGLAAAMGMAREGADILILDAGDLDFRASRGNFGLVWAQSKGAASRDYAIWTRRSIQQWPELEDEIEALCGVQTHYRRDAVGLHFCLGDEEFEKRSRIINGVASHNLPGDDTRMIDRAEALDYFPGLGDKVTGASCSSLDGACQPLALLRGLSLSAQQAGAKLLTDAAVQELSPHAEGYRVTSKRGIASAPKILIAAGLGTNKLARPFGLPDIVHPEKGQILVTERTEPMLPVTSTSLRQTWEGSILIGDTKEDTGLEDSSGSQGILTLARRAVSVLPAMARLRIVRSWAALRVLTPDGRPVYDESPTHPGIYVATTHSGVTLAPVHRGPLARWILHGEQPEELHAFSSRRLRK